MFLKPALREEGHPPCNSAALSSLPLRVKARTLRSLSQVLHLPQEVNVPHLPSGLEGFLPSRRAQPFPPCALGVLCSTQRHGVVSASHLSRELIKPWCGREHTYTEFKLLCRGYDFKNCCLGRQTTLLCLVLKGHAVLISDLVFSPPALL